MPNQRPKRQEHSLSPDTGLGDGTTHASGPMASNGCNLVGHQKVNALLNGSAFPPSGPPQPHPTLSALSHLMGQVMGRHFQTQRYAGLGRLQLLQVMTES